MFCPSVPGRCLHCFPSIFPSPKKLEKKACLIPLLPLSHTKNPLGWFLLKESQAWVRKVKLHCPGSQAQMVVRWWRMWGVSWVLSPFPLQSIRRSLHWPHRCPQATLTFFTVSDSKTFLSCFLPHQNWTRIYSVSIFLNYANVTHMTVVPTDVTKNLNPEDWLR